MIFLLSTALTFLLSIKEIPIAILQQITIVLLLILVFLSKKILSAHSWGVTNTFKLATLFLSAFLTQLFVFSTGGFYSPFLPLLHLYTLAVSFLISYQAGLVFITFSVTSLILASYLNPASLKIFQDDPATGVIYLISFVVVVPLAQLLSRNYQIKDKLVAALAKYLELGEARQETILQNVNESVVVTDKFLRVISVNTAFEKKFNVHSVDALKKDLLEVVPFAYSSGEKLAKEALLLDQLLINKTTILLKDYYVKLPSKLEKAVIQITPTLSKDGEVEQIVFVITEAKLSQDINRHPAIEQALIRQKEVGEVLKKALMDLKHPELASYAKLFAKQEEDLLTLTEIEDHPVSEVVSILDTALLCKKKFEDCQDFAKTLNVPIAFDLPKGEESELAIFDIAKDKDVLSSEWGFSHFAVPIDQKWLGIIIQKLMELAILVSSSFEKPGVSLSLERDEKEVVIKLAANSSKLDEQKLAECLTLYYGSLGQTTNLKLGSGLEGYIAKLLADELNLALSANWQDNPPQVIFSLKLAKNPQPTISQIQT